MLLNAYTIYDVKARSYSPPFFANAHGQAVRDLSDAANDPSSNLGRHPGDFTLFCIGRFDTERGLLIPHDNREHISDVLPLVRARGQHDLFTDNNGVTRSSANGSAEEVK